MRDRKEIWDEINERIEEAGSLEEAQTYTLSISLEILLDIRQLLLDKGDKK